MGHNDVHLEADELRGQFSEAIGALLCVSHLEEDVLSFTIAQLAQPVPEFFEAPLSGFIGLTGVAEEANTWHLLWRLCLGGKWRYKYAKGECDDTPDGVAPHGRLLTSASC
jgi:hypothetical protein